MTKLREIKAQKVTFYDYYISLKNLNVYSDKNGDMKLLKPRLNHGEKCYYLYSKGEKYCIKLSEIVEGLTHDS